MPILNYGRPDNWELVDGLTPGDIFTFRTFVFEAKRKVFKKNDKFLDTLEPNVNYSVPYIYSYDSSLSDYENTYINKMKELLKEANSIMHKQKELKNYRLDIMGTYNVGHIIVMRKINSEDPYRIGLKKRNLKILQKFPMFPKSGITNHFNKDYL